MEAWVTGGAWITGGGYGRLSEGRKIVVSEGKPVVPPAREIFDHPLQRYGRFDTFTKMGCACAALALKDAGTRKAEGTGMILSTRYEVMTTDVAYYRTTHEQGGLLSSPNLFSYTLPVILLGECAMLFTLTGPTFCVGEQGGRGMTALCSALEMIRAGKTDTMIAGWIDTPPEESGPEHEERVSGALFVVVETGPNGSPRGESKIRYHNSTVTMDDNGQKVSSLPDLFE